jgi:hypothetical protein
MLPMCWECKARRRLLIATTVDPMEHMNHGQFDHFSQTTNTSKASGRTMKNIQVEGSLNYQIEA